MFIRTLTAVACAVGIAGCTSYSGPTHNTDIVTLSDGTQAYRVQCLGLAEGIQACMAEIKRLCGDKQVKRIDPADPESTDFVWLNERREITFQCETPVVATSAPAVVATPVAAPVVAPVRKVTLQSDANFAVNSAVLMPAATAKLDGFIAQNRDVGIERLTIAGYTDSTGSAKLNERLSAARARSVQRYLATAGVRASMWDVQGYGAASPVAPNTTAVGRAKNRRVEIQIDGK
ncbi:OmpA family protein [Paraburkholderia diazotrophica]|uniref:OmpA family protein n=1 Tax=Paraburkholderia diazotrophica TaxID=667676 RepID=A0A1H7ECV1_9BURK|nr:OmpA family protein [Paraburkholderia diazotrophica]SEK11688.1 OmpA family protein [Paraburkholderia diazotrophica]